MTRGRVLAMTHALGSRSRHLVPDEVDDFNSYVDGSCSSLSNQQNGGIFGNSLDGAHNLTVA